MAEISAQHPLPAHFLLPVQGRVGGGQFPSSIHQTGSELSSILSTSRWEKKKTPASFPSEIKPTWIIHQLYKQKSVWGLLITLIGPWSSEHTFRNSLWTFTNQRHSIFLIIIIQDLICFWKTQESDFRGFWIHDACLKINAEKHSVMARNRFFLIISVLLTVSGCKSSTWWRTDDAPHQL